MIRRQAQFNGTIGTFNSRSNQRFIHDALYRPWIIAFRILVSDTFQQCLIHTSPVHADPDRFVILARHGNHVGKMSVFFGALPTFPGLIRYFESAFAHSGNCVSNK